MSGAAREAWLDEPDGLVEPAARAALKAIAGPYGLGECTFVGLGGLGQVWRCRLRAAPGERRRSPPTGTVGYVLHEPVAAALHVLHGCAAVVLVLAATPQGPRFAYAPPPAPLAAAGLTAREADVLAHLLVRHTVAEIGATLVVSSATVRTHRHSVYAKLGVTDRRQLLALFERCEGARRCV